MHLLLLIWNVNLTANLFLLQFYIVKSYVYCSKNFAIETTSKATGLGQIWSHIQS